MENGIVVLITIPAGELVWVYGRESWSRPDLRTGWRRLAVLWSIRRPWPRN